jgi:hypothetical protein
MWVAKKTQDYSNVYCHERDFMVLIHFLELRLSLYVIPRHASQEREGSKRIV